MVDCCRQIRRIVEEAPWGDSAHGFLVVGGEGVLVDSVDEVFRESPPILVGVTLTVLFVVAGLAFRSLLIPVRLLATVVVTLVVTAALTVLLYQLVLGYDGAATLSPQTCRSPTHLCLLCAVLDRTVSAATFLLVLLYSSFALLHAEAASSFCAQASTGSFRSARRASPSALPSTTTSS